MTDRALFSIVQRLGLTVTAWKGLWRAETKGRFALGETFSDAIMAAHRGDWGA